MPSSPARKVIVVGGGIAGLSCALELVHAKRRHPVEVTLLEARTVVGGRTSSWVEDGMPIESGLHRYLGFYKYLPRILHRAGISLNDMLFWEDAFDVRLPDGEPTGHFSVSPIHRPLRMLASLAGNTRFISQKDKASLIPFFAAGMADYVRKPKELDQETVLHFARRHGVTERAIERLLVPLTAGIFFIPPERYSAYNLFGLVVPYLPRTLKMRVGGFKGGMTEVMADPIAHAIEKHGGTVRRGVEIAELMVRESVVVGVRDHQGTEHLCDHVVLATSLAPAQKILAQAFPSHPAFESLQRLDSMPAITVQLDLDRPALPQDKVTFSPGTCFASYSEQSRTTFRGTRGRLSLILTPPEKFIDMEPQKILDHVLADARRLRLDLGTVERYRVVRLPKDFYSLAPGHDHLRPTQETPIPGLSLAGDYTRQIYLATMEGAAYSGIVAARLAARGETRENPAA